MIVVDPGKCTAGVTGAVDNRTDCSGERAAPLALPRARRQLVAGNDQHATATVHEFSEPRRAITYRRRDLVENDERSTLEVRGSKTARLLDVDAERRTIADRERTREI